MLYLIAPTKDSVLKLCQDFPETNLDADGNEIDFDQYGNVHIAFCSPCDDDLLDLIIKKSHKLAKRVASLIEVNLDF